MGDQKNEMSKIVDGKFVVRKQNKTLLLSLGKWWVPFLLILFSISSPYSIKLSYSPIRFVESMSLDCQWVGWGGLWEIQKLLPLSSLYNKKENTEILIKNQIISLYQKMPSYYQVKQLEQLSALLGGISEGELSGESNNDYRLRRFSGLLDKIPPDSELLSETLSNFSKIPVKKKTMPRCLLSKFNEIPIKKKIMPRCLRPRSRINRHVRLQRIITFEPGKTAPTQRIITHELGKTVPVVVGAYTAGAAYLKTRTSGGFRWR